MLEEFPVSATKSDQKRSLLSFSAILWNRRIVPIAILVLFTIYLQSLHFYLQSKPLDPKNIKVDSLNQFEKI